MTSGARKYHIKQRQGAREKFTLRMQAPLLQALRAEAEAQRKPVNDIILAALMAPKTSTPAAQGTVARTDAWPPLKKALWDVVTSAKLNDGYVNAWDLTERLYQAALSASPPAPTEALPASGVERARVEAFCVERRKQRFPGGGKTIDGAALIGAFDWGVLAVFDALAALSPTEAPAPRMPSREWLREKITSDPDDMELEARPTPAPATGVAREATRLRQAISTATAELAQWQDEYHDCDCPAGQSCGCREFRDICTGLECALIDENGASLTSDASPSGESQS